MTPQRTVTRSWIVGCLLVATLAACGGATGESGGDYQPTGTVPVPPTGTVPVHQAGDGLEWSPAHEPGVAEEALVDALEKLGRVMVLPTTAPPLAVQTTAVFQSRALGYPSGVTFSGTEVISLTVDTPRGTMVVVSTPADLRSCPGDSLTVTVRGDPDALVCSGSFDEIWWDEAGRAFHASLAGDLTLEEGLTWLESWWLVP